MPLVPPSPPGADTVMVPLSASTFTVAPLAPWMARAPATSLMLVTAASGARPALVTAPGATPPATPARSA